MEEKIVDVTAGGEATCSVCAGRINTGDRAVFCPRCRSPHHLQCWIDRGGCARKGCKQVVSPGLLPKKEETPIQVKRVPRWVYPLVGFLIAAVALGLVYNARRAAAERMRTVAVLLPASVDQDHWERVGERYTERLAPQGKKVLITFVPNLLPVTADEPDQSFFYDQKLIVQIAAKDAPELVLITADRIAAYIEQGVLLPVDDILPLLGDTVDRDRLQSAMRDGVAYAVPHPAQTGFLAVPRFAKHPSEGLELLTFAVREFTTVPGEETAEGTAD